MAKKINIEEVQEMAKKTAEEVSEMVKETAEEVSEMVKDVTEKVPAAKKAAEKTTEVTEKAKKTTKKAASTVKKTAKKAAEKVTPVQETFVEYDGKQILVEEVLAKVKEAYKAEGHRITSIKSIRTYINPYEGRAYYVINDKAEGKFVEL